MADLSATLVPSVTPDKMAPDDRQNINATPESFGAAIGRGEEKLGAGAEQASSNLFQTSEFFGKVAADNASNDYQDFATKLLHGDPNKTIAGPDGQPIPDTGYLGLRGRAALDARPDIEKQLDERLKSTRATLTSPQQQLEFDNFSRRYRAGVAEKVGSHADGQATSWYQSVNVASSKLALDQISMNADNPQEYLAGEADLVHAYVKTAQLAGAQPGDPQYDEAVASARRDALKARLDQVAVKNPAQAVAILDKPENRAIAGQYYDNMSSSYRGRAKQQQGYDVGKQTLLSTYTNNPAPNPVLLTNAGLQYGVSGSYLMRVHQMEGNGVSSTGAKGPFQFTETTARQYGLKDPFNYQESADAAARFTADNRVALTASLGRTPTDPELYLAHNQGADGAAKLLAHPNVRAGDLVGDRAIRVNGGDPNAPAINFTSMLTNKYNAAPVAAAQNRKADAFQRLESIPDDQIDPDVREHARSYIAKELTAQQIAEEQDAKAKKAVSDQAQADYTRRIVKGDTNGIIGQISDDPRLSASEIQNLYKFAIGDGGVSDPLQYGPAYSGALKRILAAPDAPDRINGPQDIIQMGAEQQLTKRGVNELLETQKKLQADPESAGVTRTKSAQLDYYKSQFSIDQEMTLPGMKPYKNQKGLDKFNHDFVPAFESAYGDWVASGKKGMDFLKDKKQLDGIMDTVYPPSERAKDAIAAEGPKAPDMTLPPVPDGLNKNTFETIVKHPPVGMDGKQWTPTAFGTAIDRLRSDPSPEMKAGFNRWFGKAGFDADEILRKLPPKPPKAAKAAEVHPLAKVVSDNAVAPNPNEPEPENVPAIVGIRG